VDVDVGTAVAVVMRSSGGVAVSREVVSIASVEVGISPKLYVPAPVTAGLTSNSTHPLATDALSSSTPPIRGGRAR
jgi:hypothetical protein